MATTYLGIIPGSRQADERFQDTLNRVYRETHLISSSADATPPEVYATAGLPQFNDAYSEDPSAIVKERRVADRNETRTLWMVEVVFDNIIEKEQEDEQDDGNNQPSINLHGELIWTYETIQEVLTVDKSSPPKEVATAAGEPFTAPPVMRLVPISVLTWARWQLSFGGGAEQLTWMATVNDRAWLGAAPREVLCAGISARQQFMKGFVYWRVTDVLKFRKGKWDVTVPNKGSFHLEFDTTGTKVRKKCVDNTKEKNPVVCYLSPDGLSPHHAPNDIVFQPYESRNFAQRYGG